MIAGEDSTLADTHHTYRNFFGKLERSFEFDFKGAQIAVVHADDGCAAFDCLSEFELIMHFDQCVEAQGASKFAQAAHVVRAQQRGNEQDGIRTVGGSLNDVKLFECEVFA